MTPSAISSDSRGDSLKQSCLGVGNLKTRTLRQQLTIIYSSMFRLHIYIYIYIYRERERERERICKVLWTDTETRPHSIPTELSECKLLTTNPLANWQFFFPKFANFYIFKLRISVGWCHLAKLLRHLSHVPNSLFSFPLSNLSQKRYEFILFTFWPSCVDRYVLA